MANSITRTYTFANGGVADGGQVDSEIQNIVNTINNADAGTTTWTNVKVATLTSTTTTALKGTTTNDSAAAGNIGEYIESVVSNVNFPTSTQYGDAASISLTAGDWDVTGNMQVNPNGATFGAATDLGISQTSGNSSTGLVAGSNHTSFNISGTQDQSMSAPTYRISLASTTIIYLKFAANYSVATPQARGARLSARRVR